MKHYLLLFILLVGCGEKKAQMKWSTVDSNATTFFYISSKGDMFVSDSLKTIKELYKYLRIYAKENEKKDSTIRELMLIINGNKSEYASINP